MEALAAAFYFCLAIFDKFCHNLIDWFRQLLSLNLFKLAFKAKPIWEISYLPPREFTEFWWLFWIAEMPPELFCCAPTPPEVEVRPALPDIPGKKYKQVKTSFIQVFTGFNRFWQVLACFGIFWQVLTDFDRFDRLWQVLTGFGSLW